MKWWHSYNAIAVPIQWGEQCFLVSAQEFALNRFASWGFDDDENEEEKRRIATDCAHFLALYQSRIDLRGIGPSRELQTIQNFFRDHVRGMAFRGLTDNQGVTAALKEAVRRELVVPHIERNWVGIGRVLEPHYAPQYWPRSASSASWGGDSRATKADTGRFTGPFAAAMHASDIVMNAGLRRGGSVFGGGGAGFDWLEAVETAAGVALGSKAAAEDDDSGPMKSFTDSTTPVGDAEPFEYAEGSPLSDVFDIAARGVSEAQEADCFFLYEQDLELCEFARATYQDMRTYALCKQRAFQNYQTCRGF
ncbi:hypothetical protein AWB74_01260 [Caballeronia arvi]|uniref:Uncharacterized protein n=1 Tax=Caballeronia arvi TaxID=1777135 RepID=A0A158G7Y2_9BURK|nr:hypothetical protein [Caballeronia arvi]SAL28258.1 hypothetical protein AWB74_01260 [Caballeronia arvi]